MALLCNIASIVFGSASLLLLFEVVGSATSILDLRRATFVGTAGRFVANRRDLEEEILKSISADEVCGNAVDISLNVVSLEDFIEDSCDKGEVYIGYVNMTEIIDDDLAERMEQLKDDWKSSVRMFIVSIPVISNSQHRLLQHLTFVEYDTLIPAPMATNKARRIVLDTIQEYGNGSVSLHIGNDVLLLSFESEGNNGELPADVGSDIDNMTGESTLFTSYADTFDWGCDSIGWDVGYCQVLDEYRCAIERYGGDVCTEFSTHESCRIPTTMRIVKMTGIFREYLPFLANEVPIQSFEAMKFQRERGLGITFPCLTVE